MSAEHKGPLAVSRARNPDAEPFAGDLFERKAIGERLTELVERLPEGGVIAIDAGWGEGKTWFARNWSAALTAQGFRTVYLDAFEADYVEDAFLLITAELLSVLQEEPKDKVEKLRDGARKVASVVLPVVTKATIRAVSVGLTGIDFSKGLDKALDGALENAGDQAGELISAAIKTRIEELQVRRKSVAGFRENLSDTLGAFPKPLVFLVDELDRCKPPFAVQLLERIKHFFTIPKIVFVLFLNKSQLEASVRGLYGPDIDSSTYLSKFLTLSLTLPAKLSEESRQSEFAWRFCAELGRRLGYEGRPGFDDFSESLSQLAPLFGMSFREIERAFTYYGLAGRSDTTASLIAYLCALKVSEPELFKTLAHVGSKECHRKISDYLTGVGANVPAHQPWILRATRAAHLALGGGVDTLTAEESVAFAEFQKMFRHHRGVDEIFAYWARRLDLQIP